jgi:hypothetical protein
MKGSMRFLVIIAVAFGFAAGITVTAYAQGGNVRNLGWTYTSPNADCTLVVSEIGLDPGNSAYTFGQVKPHHYGTSQCQNNVSRLAGTIQMQQVLWKWNQGIGQWGVCHEEPTKYNSSVTTVLEYFRWYGAAPCGPGTYGNNVYGAVYVGGWHGGWLWSGNWNY